MASFPGGVRLLHPPAEIAEVWTTERPSKGKFALPTLTTRTVTSQTYHMASLIAVVSDLTRITSDNFADTELAASSKVLELKWE
jgi:hypothetical protein